MLIYKVISEVINVHLLEKELYRGRDGEKCQMLNKDKNK